MLQIVVGFVLVIFTTLVIAVFRKATTNTKKRDGPALDERIAKQGFTMKHVPNELDAIVIGSGIGGLAAAACL